MPSAIPANECVTTTGPLYAAAEFRGMVGSATAAYRHGMELPGGAGTPRGCRGHEHPKACEQEQTQETGPTKAIRILDNQITVLDGFPANHRTKRLDQ